MDPILGQIILWPAPWVPQGWALCDGSVINVNQNQALYSIIGNTYGGVPGQSFALPDLRNRVPMGTQTMNVPGVKSGNATVTGNLTGTGSVQLSVANLPAHNHPATLTPSGGSATATVAIPVVSNPGSATATPGTSTHLSAVTTTGADTIGAYSTDAANTTLAPFTISAPAGGGTVTIGNTGTGTPAPVQVTVPMSISTVQPSLSMNYIIATTGIYPSRP
jgi:microcystin-dependent protein